MTSSRFAFVCLTLAAVLLSLPSSSTADDAIMQFVKSTIKEHPVVVFSKSYCPYCRRAKATFAQMDVTPHVIELDLREDGAEIQDALLDFIGRRTVPQVFVSGEHIGGSDDTVEAFESGRLKQLVDSALQNDEL